MAYNNMNNRQPGRNNFARHDFSGPSRDREMFKTVCSECGKECQVPFRPSGERPVYCSDCYSKKQGESSPRNFERKDFNKPRFDNRDSRPPQNNEQFNAINSKLDRILAILNPESAEKVVFAPKAQVVEAVAEEEALPAVVEEPAVKVEKKKRVSKKAVSAPKE